MNMINLCILTDHAEANLRLVFASTAILLEFFTYGEIRSIRLISDLAAGSL
jgi:hypothetical protein